LQRLAEEIDGWLELRCPDQALERLQPLLDDPAARPAALAMRVRALARLGDHQAALTDLAELRATGLLADWVDLTEAWCRRRVQDLPGAIRLARTLVARNPKSEIGHYNLACYLALAGDRPAAIDAISLACGLDPHLRDHARDEPDLDGLRTEPQFRALIRAEDEAASLDADEDEDEDGDEDDLDDDLDADADEDPPPRPASPGRN
jgi:predicted Zn-dependent protease